MQATSKFTRKVLSQIITMYQWVIEIDIEELWIKLTIKPNRWPDDMVDVINAKLIDVCEEFLNKKDIWLDKYQLSTICAQLVTQAIDDCEEPFWISVKWNKPLIQDYLEKNKNKIKTLERIKKENEELDKEIQELQEVAIQQQSQLSNVHINNVEPQPVPKPTITPRNIPISRPTNKSTITKKAKYRGTGTADLLIDDSFSLPSWR